MAEIEPGVTLIRGGRLADPAKRRAEPTDILIEDGVIRAVGAGLAAPEGARIVDAGGFLLHPGLVNAHTHGHGALARGMGDRWTLELLLAAAPWIGGGRALQDKKLSAQINAAEMLMKGEGTNADPTRAIGLYEQASAGGLTGPASLAIGLYFRTQDEPAKAALALRAAADAGEGEAKLALGQMLHRHLDAADLDQQIVARIDRREIQGHFHDALP